MEGEAEVPRAARRWQRGDVRELEVEPLGEGLVELLGDPLGEGLGVGVVIRGITSEKGRATGFAPKAAASTR